MTRHDDHREFMVELETDAIADLAVALSATTDTFARELESRTGVSGVSAGANSSDRTLLAQYTAHCAHAVDAIHHAVESLQRTAKKHGLGALGLRSVSAEPHRVAPPQMTHAKDSAWPPQFQNRHERPASASRGVPVASHTAAQPHGAEPAASPGTGADLVRLVAGVTGLARELRSAGEPDSARALERYMGAEVPSPEVVLRLRQELSQIRSIHMPVINNLEGRIDELILLASRSLSQRPGGR